MAKVLLTGGNGFVGRNVLPILKEKFDVEAPTRQELNLKDGQEVREYLLKNKFDAVIHSANPNPIKNVLDEESHMLEDSLRLFMNFYNARELFGKLIFLGSGAEYDKSHPIINIKEEDYGKRQPKDAYGFAKSIMTTLAMSSENVYNLCVFGCYGATDHSSKFITHCIRCCLSEKPITIRQDCWFDFLHVSDLARMMSWMVTADPEKHLYNAGSGRHILLSEIAEIVKRKMGSDKPVVIQKPGLNHEYTANSSRIFCESGLTPLVSIEQGIALQIEWEKKVFEK